jgi:hypothetical protein
MPAPGGFGARTPAVGVLLTARAHRSRNDFPHLVHVRITIATSSPRFAHRLTRTRVEGRKWGQTRAFARAKAPAGVTRPPGLVRPLTLLSR